MLKLIESIVQKIKSDLLDSDEEYDWNYYKYIK